MTARQRLGILIPSSNTVLEPLAARNPVQATVHFSRLAVHDVTLGAVSRAQFDLDARMQAARLLCDAGVRAIVWGGTSASWLGVDHDLRFVDRLGAETGIAGGSAVLEIYRQISEMGARRLGLVTPYTHDVADRIALHFAACGHEVAASSRHGGTLSRDFATIGADTIARMIREAVAPGVDAVVIMCTNLRGADVAEALRAEIGVPVIDSAIATFQAGQRLL
jgi:maleate isomerase